MSLMAAADFSEKTGIPLEKIAYAARLDKALLPKIRRKV